MKPRHLRRRSPGIARCGRCGDWLSVEELQNAREKIAAMNGLIVGWAVLCESCLLEVDPAERMPSPGKEVTDA